jgi:hypothetical protein
LLRLNDARVVERTSQEDDCQYGWTQDQLVADHLRSAT